MYIWQHDLNAAVLLNVCFYGWRNNLVYSLRGGLESWTYRLYSTCSMSVCVWACQLAINVSTPLGKTLHCTLLRLSLLHACFLSPGERGYLEPPRYLKCSEEKPNKKISGLGKDFPFCRGFYLKPRLCPWDVTPRENSNMAQDPQEAQLKLLLGRGFGFFHSRSLNSCIFG